MDHHQPPARSRHPRPSSRYGAAAAARATRRPTSGSPTAAAELMLQRGFDRTTVDDVAARAGVGKATVYRRWPSKEDLAVAAMETLYSAEMPEPDTGSIRDRPAAELPRGADLREHPRGRGLPAHSIAESVRDEPDRGALPRRRPSAASGSSRVTFERAIERGEVRPDIDVDSRRPVARRPLAIRAITHRPMPAVDDAERWSSSRCAASSPDALRPAGRPALSRSERSRPAGRPRTPRGRTAPGRRRPRRGRPASPARPARAARRPRCRPWRSRRAWSARCR